MRSNRCAAHPIVTAVLAMATLLVVMNRSAHADLQFELNQTLNGSTPLRANTSLNWYLRVTATDIGTPTEKSVKLTIIGNLGKNDFGEDESIHSIGFNIAKGIIPGALTAINIVAIGKDSFNGTFGEDVMMVEGGGNFGKNFDYRIDFATSNNDKNQLFAGKDVIVLNLLGVASSDLNYLSPDGVYFGAHIQRLPGEKSGFVGNVPLALPEPTGFMLTLIGMLPLGVLVRRVRSWNQ